ncbi:MAG TPA: ATP-binding protein [Thermoflexia bacterium]|nr:ATP-binding protein [Thermoflexia bacterium]
MIQREQATDLSLQHLLAELRRIDILVQREVRRWQLAGQDPHDDFRGLYLSDTDAQALLARPWGVSWGQTISLSTAETDAFAQAEIEITARIEELKKEAASRKISLRLEYLAATFELDRFALDLLLICLAPHFDLQYERLYAYLQDNVTCKNPTINLSLALLAPPGDNRLLALPYFSENAPLFKHRLLQQQSDLQNGRDSLLSRTLHVDEAIVAWLLGNYQPPTELRGHISLEWSEPNARDTLLTAALPDNWLETQKRATIMAFYGPDATTQHAAARLAALHVQRPLLRVALPPLIADEQLTPHLAIRLALRDARLNAALTYFTGWDACLQAGQLPIAILTELESCALPLIVAGKKRWLAEGLERQRPLWWVNFPLPHYAQRLSLWEHFVVEEFPDYEGRLDALAGQFRLTAGQIRDAVATARDQVVQQHRAFHTTNLFAAARAHSSPHLSDLARQIVPRYQWADIVLPAEQLELLHEIVDMVRGRSQVLEAWGVGKKLATNNGIAMLFGGPPGTGKTMAAEVIATELELDLYKIDLSTIVSKYIGETEKNLERIFSEAQSSNVILFFDEADALFGKRSAVKDAHDRYANIETSYLLQRMEAYDGVTILATNMRANLDEAFTRRLQFAVSFPFPEEEYRLRIWQTLFPATVPRAENLDFELLARRFKLAGGNIRNIIVFAAFLAAADAGAVTMQHLFQGTRREMQKMGRLVKEAEMQ